MSRFPQVPIISLEGVISFGLDDPRVLPACRKVDDALRRFGMVIVRDPRIDPKLFGTNLRLWESYFQQETAVKQLDERADHQVGWTPSGIEKPIQDLRRLQGIEPRALPSLHKGPDNKERFFAEIGPGSQQFDPPAILQKDDAWHSVIMPTGSMMIESAVMVLQMFSTANRMDPDTFTYLMQEATHRLGPTGSDLSQHCAGTALAGWHTDLNLLSIHGKASCPGLVAWKRDGHPIICRLPDNYLLMQAGEELEILTGGAVWAGIHEVVVMAEAENWAQEQLAKDNTTTPWRVSTTLFGHVEEDAMLEPIGTFNTPEARTLYPSRRAGDHVSDTIKRLGLATV